MKRLFAAIKIQPDPEFMKQFHELKRQLSFEKIKWVEDHNIHITLKFFGETEESEIPGIKTALQKTASGNMSFGFCLRSVGIFGSRYDPRVIWTGIEPYDSLAILMKTIREDLRVAGFVPDRQNLVPHLTLGRIKEIRDKQHFQEVIGRYREMASKEMIAGEFLLYESILKREGPVYVALYSFPFQKQRR
jgi:RNA 2',3'-cyclic 3'-phosphodiesterase